MKFALALLLASLPLLAIDGVAVNVTTGKPQPGVGINLVQPSQDGMVPLGNATTDAQGVFKIDKQIPPGPGLIQATYQGTTYNQIITPGMPTTGIQVKVYDATKKSGVSKILEHLILLEPGVDNLRVSETFVLGNETNVTFNDPVKGSIQFYLPPATAGKAQVVVTAPGGMPITRPPLKTATAGIYKVDYPTKPGETRMDVTYTIPATDKFAGKVVASESATHLVTPPAVTVTGDGIEPAGREPQTQANIYNLTGLDYNLLIDGIGSLREESTPAQGEEGGSPPVEVKKPRLYSQLFWVLGLALGILALGGTMLYRRGPA
ncbi:MAG: hypothetical protein M3O20_04170 [Acidobacteriota bacterium]|nr:hypothetical protein [Acidobacteriota bacterium]